MDRQKFLKYLHNPHLLNETTLDELRKLTEDFPWFQLGWMLYLRNLKTVQSPEYDDLLKKVAILVPDRKQLYNFINGKQSRLGLSVAETGAADYQLGGECEGKGDSLIDKFLTSDFGSARIKNRKVTVAGEQVLEKALNEGAEIITETLAEIYVQQKNYGKALDAYEKLSLKYPEKNVYFASRVKEIEVLKNNN